MKRSNLSYRVEEPSFSGEQAAGRVPPNSLESEQAVLGGILLDNEALNSALEILRPEDFYKQAHGIIWRAMLAISDRHEPIDVITLSSELKAGSSLEGVGGVEYLSYLVDAVPTSANSQYYARIVKEMSLRRKLIHEASEIVEEAMNTRGNIDGFIDSVEQRIFQVSEARINPSFSRVGEIVKDSIKHVEHLYMNKGQLTGVPSGFYDLDDMTSGFQASDLIILAGRPSMGKTSLVLSVARHIGVDCNKRVAVFSLEMSKEQIVLRLLCSEARVSNSLVRSGNLGESDFPKLVEAASKIAQADVFIDDTPAISVLEMRAKARRLHKEAPLSMIIVDYLQLMRGSGRTQERREQEISEISSSLKALAKELHIPVIALSQLNRAVETRQDKRPVMADLRESGAIEQDADIIGFVYRDEVYHPETPDKGIAELIIGKHRNGPVGTVRLSFQGEYTLFENLAEDAEEYDDYLGADIGLVDEDDDLLI
ncbi:MAG: replicative DNA helicase [Bdellovibrionales bacterium]|nr:replicative DNA helicase [Bdellovibrionales bacterium]